MYLPWMWSRVMHVSNAIIPQKDRSNFNKHVELHGLGPGSSTPKPVLDPNSGEKYISQTYTVS
jgi:hypothetical protein